MAISSSASASALSYTQANRPLQITTVLGENVLILTGLSGEEAVSVPFSMTLDMASTQPGITAEDVLGTPVLVTIVTPEGDQRLLHGLVRRFKQAGRTETGLVAYHAEMVPWFWFLSLSTDCRIFQNMNAIEIAEQVFGDLGYADFKNRCLKTPPKREYCVQYRETHLDFISRLFEEEGIFYFFEHTDQKHVLNYADSNQPVAYSAASPSAKWMPVREGMWPASNAVRNFERELSVGSKAVTLTDYDFVSPSLTVRRGVAGELKGQKGEVYDYPGGAIDPDGVERYALLRLQEAESAMQVVRGESNCRGFQCGTKFDLKDHYRADLNQAYHLIRVRHQARIDNLTPGGGEPMLTYTNEFEAIPNKLTYHPPSVTPKPRVYGSQTAVVVGRSGEEIYVDKHGRVKVQFHWDRKGGKDENSSCWVRVSSAWAGKGWGAIEIPRMGQEVVVDFLEGDPDRPIITGRVYNGEQVPPYALPANMTQSGTKSRSSKGGSDANFNEIRFEDKKGDEELFIHAEKDELHEVEHDRRRTVGHDESVSVGNDQSIEVEHDQSIQVGNNRTKNVAGNEVVGIDKNRTENVTGNETISIDGTRSEHVGKTETIDIVDTRTTTLGKDEQVTIKGKRKVEVGDTDDLDVKTVLTIVAGDKILLQAGDASIALEKDGTITIQGKDIKVTGSGKINMTADSAMTLKGSEIAQN